MIDVGRITEISSGIYYTIVPQFTTALLPSILMPSVPYIWLVRHRPTSAIKWGQTAVPLAPHCTPRSLLVRDLEYDCLLGKAEFDLLLPELRDTGVTLLQMDRLVPDSLTYRRLPSASRSAILANAGCQLEVSFPFPGEYAEVTSVSHDWLERVVAGLSGPA